jgi:excinuclease ABC subunit A
VTGVSGSGKSTLVNDILYRALAKSLYRSREHAGEHKAISGVENIDKVIRIDQSPIGRTPRSNPATYTGVFTHIRDLYAMLPESRERGYKPGRFSFNVAGGRCEACQGEGQRRIEMNFLPDVYVICEICGGRRYNQETLAVKYKGYSIADLLESPVSEALPILENIPQVKQKLQTLVDVGLGYVHLGQSAVTLSGGEAQRIKLARELSKRQTGRTLYLLDEPTTGLHFDDVRKLLDVLHRLTDLGNTIIIIEHNLDVIRNADWIIDLGPEGGEDGGRLVAQGTPEQVARNKKSYTGQALANYFVVNGRKAAGVPSSAAS